MGSVTKAVTPSVTDLQWEKCPHCAILESRIKELILKLAKTAEELTANKIANKVNKEAGKQKLKVYREANKETRKAYMKKYMAKRRRRKALDELTAETEKLGLYTFPREAKPDFTKPAFGEAKDKDTSQ